MTPRPVEKGRQSAVAPRPQKKNLAAYPLTARLNNRDAWGNKGWQIASLKQSRRSNGISQWFVRFRTRLLAALFRLLPPNEKSRQLSPAALGEITNETARRYRGR